MTEAWSSAPSPQTLNPKDIKHPLMFSDNFNYDDKRTAKANLGQLLHHYDDVSPTIRVIQYDPRVGGFPLSMVPPPSDDERETIINHLDENGFTAERINGIIHVTAQHES